MNTTPSLVILAAGLAFAGCSRDSNSTPPATPPPPPPQAQGGGYFGTMAKAEQSAVKTVDLTSLNQNIQLFNASEGRNPKDLNELVTSKYIPRIPDAPMGMKLVYDATQGKVTMEKQ